MGDGVRNGAGGQFEMRHAAAAKAQEQPHGASVRRVASGVAPRVFNSKGVTGTDGIGRSLADRRGQNRIQLGAAFGGLLRGDMTSSTLTADQALDEFRAAGALFTGHFILSSGLHSPVFLQKMFVFQDPVRTERLCRALAMKARESFGSIDVVASPALGGIVPGYETARWLAPRRSSSSARAASSGSVAGSRLRPARAC